MREILAELGVDLTQLRSGLAQGESLVDIFVRRINSKLSASTPAELRGLGAATQNLGKWSTGVEKAALSNNKLLISLNRMSGMFTAGLGIGTTLGGFALLERAFTRGIDKARAYQTATLAIAASLQSSNKIVTRSGRELTGVEGFRASYAQSRELNTEIIRRQAKNILTYEEQLGAFQSTIASGARKGLSTKQILDLSEQIAIVSKTLGSHGEEISDSARLLLGGGVNVARSKIGRSLGISNRDIATRSGDELEKFIGSKTSGFAAGSKDFELSIEGVMSTLEAKFDVWLFKVGMKFFKSVTPTLRKMGDFFDSGGADKLGKIAAKGFENLFNGLEKIVNSGALQVIEKFIEFLANNGDKILIIGALSKLINVGLNAIDMLNRLKAAWTAFAVVEVASGGGGGGAAGILGAVAGVPQGAKAEARAAAEAMRSSGSPLTSLRLATKQQLSAVDMASLTAAGLFPGIVAGSSVEAAQSFRTPASAKSYSTVYTGSYKDSAGRFVSKEKAIEGAFPSLRSPVIEQRKMEAALALEQKEMLAAQLALMNPIDRAKYKVGKSLTGANLAKVAIRGGIGYGVGYGVGTAADYTTQAFGGSKQAGAGVSAMLANAGTFAGVGSTFGPVGTAIGAVVGFSKGLIDAFSDLRESTEAAADGLKKFNEEHPAIAEVSDKQKALAHVRELLAGRDPNDATPLTPARIAYLKAIEKKAAANVEKAKDDATADFKKNADISSAEGDVLKHQSREKLLSEGFGSRSKQESIQAHLALTVAGLKRDQLKGDISDEDYKRFEAEAYQTATQNSHLMRIKQASGMAAARPGGSPFTTSVLGALGSTEQERGNYDQKDFASMRMGMVNNVVEKFFDELTDKVTSYSRSVQDLQMLKAETPLTMRKQQLEGASLYNNANELQLSRTGLQLTAERLKLGATEQATQRQRMGQDFSYNLQQATFQVANAEINAKNASLAQKTFGAEIGPQYQGLLEAIEYKVKSEFAAAHPIDSKSLEAAVRQKYQNQYESLGIAAKEADLGKTQAALAPGRLTEDQKIALKTSDLAAKELDLQTKQNVLAFKNNELSIEQNNISYAELTMQITRNKVALQRQEEDLLKSISRGGRDIGRSKDDIANVNKALKHTELDAPIRITMDRNLGSIKTPQIAPIPPRNEPPQTVHNNLDIKIPINVVGGKAQITKEDIDKIITQVRSELERQCTRRP